MSVFLFGFVLIDSIYTPRPHFSVRYVAVSFVWPAI